jgi:hypothetical protein
LGLAEDADHRFGSCDGVLDTNTISNRHHNGPPINLTDPRLLFTGGQLIFTPGVSDLLGDLVNK